MVLVCLSLISLKPAKSNAKIFFPKIDFDIIVVDHNSKKEDVEKIKKQLNKSQYKNYWC